MIFLSTSAACTSQPALTRGLSPRVDSPVETVKHSALSNHPASSPAQETRTTDTQGREQGRRFWVADKHFYFSRWYAGKHRKMISFGCTRAPYYSPSPLCAKERGFHHGLDIAMACGTRLFAGFAGKVVRPHGPGSLGPAYGRFAFRLRNHRIDRDVVFGHVRKVYVRPGERVSRGDLVARASDVGAPDGCHFHFEVRPKAGSYDQAVNPRSLIDLRCDR